MTNLRRLTAGDDRSGFSCGDQDLDGFFHRYANQHQQRRVSATYVATEEERIVGFMTVVAATMSRTELGVLRGFPPFPLPILLLARMGVATAVQGKGLGKQLLRHALSLACEMADSVGCVGMVVDAKLRAVGFYQNLGFTPLGTIAPPGATTKLFVPISAIPSGR